MLDGDLDLGPVTGTYYSLFQNETNNIPTVTPSLLTQTRRITRHNVPVTRYKSVIKNGHDWSPASRVLTSLLTSRVCCLSPWARRDFSSTAKNRINSVTQVRKP